NRWSVNDSTGDSFGARQQRRTASGPGGPRPRDCDHEVSGHQQSRLRHAGQCFENAHSKAQSDSHGALADHRRARPGRVDAGDWNTLKVRIEKDRLRCFVNGDLVFESAEFDPAGAKVGLAKFRDTVAEFKNFQIAKEIVSPRPPDDVVKRIMQSVANISLQNPAKPELVKSLLPHADLSLRLLRDRAKLLEQEAGQLRQLAQAVHHRRVEAELVKALQDKEEDIDLVHAALLVARLD